jgi:hypothetical protein
VGITEVVKVVLEDKASGPAKAMAGRITSALNLTGNDAAKLQSKIEGTFSGFVTSAPASISAVAGLGAAFVAVGAAAIKAAYDSDKEWEKFSGKQTAMVQSIDDVSGAISKIQVDAGKMFFNLLGGSAAADQLAQNLLKVDKALRTKNSTAFWNSLGQTTGTGDFGGWLAEALASETDLDVIARLRKSNGRRNPNSRRNAAPKPAPETIDFSDEGLSVTARTQAQRDTDAKQAADARERASKEREKASKEREEWAREDAQVAEDHANALLSIERNKLKNIENAKLKAFRRESEAEQAAHDIRIQFAQDTERLALEQAEEAAERRAYFSEYEKERKEDAKRAQQENIDGINELIGTISGGAGDVRNFWETMANGASSSEAKIKSVINLIGTIGGGILNLFAPGAGSALSGVASLATSFFAHGGSIPHAAQGMRIPGVGHGDNTLVMAKPGETIVPTNATHPSFAREVAAALGGVTGGATHVTINQGYVVPPTQTQTKRMTQETLIPAMRSLITDNRARLSDPQVRGTARGSRR